MVPGLTGALVSGDFADRLVAARFGGRLGERDRHRAAARLLRWWRALDVQCGPASSVRFLVEAGARPLAEALGFDVVRVDAPPGDLWTMVLTRGAATVPLLVVPWRAPLDAAWRSAVRSALLYRAAWCLVFNGPQLRLVDAARAHARRHLEFELPLALEHAPAFAVLWGLLRADAFTAGARDGRDLVGEVVAASDEEGRRVSASLRLGVRTGIEHMLTALVSDERRRGAKIAAADLHGEALIAVYRLLFLLFAEARQLVPTWHPIYRESYSVDALRRTAVRERSTPGMWEALQAIGRLAHTGCRAEDLDVTAFNGRLFSPRRAPRLEAARLDDAVVRDALLAVSTVEERGGGGRQRIAFGDLGVEELGAVYEGLLDYEPLVDADGGGSAAPLPGPTARPARNRAAGETGTRRSVQLVRTGSARRKATGTFYTPALLTRYLVQQTLDPLTAELGAEEILGLRVCDPAMGSGAFLVAACRHLASAYEAALVAGGGCAETDLDERDRAGFRRLVAQRCLFGVDLNPMAVQLARLSLWLTTLSADQPLTFLDHHLVCGDSLLGASPSDLLRSTTVRERTGDDRQLPLFDPSELAALVHDVLPVRHHLERAADLTAAAVHEKEAALAALEQRADLRRWRSACDIWAAHCCLERPAPAPVLRALLDEALHGTSPVPARVLAPLRDAASELAAGLRFLHWPLVFPEVFHDAAGSRRPDAGFDAVIGNPPWEMLRADAGERRAHESGRACLRFARRSGLYTARATGHANQYQLFIDRSLDLTRRGGRVGLVVPAGLAIDAGAAPLRRRLLHQCQLETIDGFENRAALFPIHRSTRFLLVTATRGGRTAAVRCRFGLDDPAALEAARDSSSGGTEPLVLTPPLLERLSGADFAIPHVCSKRDLQITEKLAAAHPRLADARGWQAHFARELNATDHRGHFRTDGRGLPVLEGKHVTPFRVSTAGATHSIDAGRAETLLGAARAVMDRARVAFRDVAGAGNRQTVISAIVPAGCVTTHTLFCLRSRMALADQRVLCAILNSHPLNFLVRQRVSTHVTLAVVRTIPIPRPAAESPLHVALDRGVRALESSGSNGPAPEEEVAAVQAMAALAFDLTDDEFEHILSTFPLEPDAVRRLAVDVFTRERRRGCLR